MGREFARLSSRIGAASRVKISKRLVSYSNWIAPIVLFESSDIPEETPELVEVLTPVAVAGAYTYRVPGGMRLQVGSIVRVPLGSREVVGAVWGIAEDDASRRHKLKPVLRHYENAPPLSAELMRFVDWVANWTLAAPGMVLRMALSVEDALEPEEPVFGVRLAAKEPPARMTPARLKVLEALGDGLARTKTALAQEVGVSVSVVDGLLKLGALEASPLSGKEAGGAPKADYAPPTLTPAQNRAAEVLRAAVGAGFSVTLLDGVTGSGKTEVYFEAVAEALRQDRQALILLPEIALTGQFLSRFERRFGVRPVEWHSQISPKRRTRAWREVASGEAKIVIGARSGLFLPFRDLGLLVVDEEHDGAYKQDDRVPYNARDMGVVRGHISAFPVVLASATPSIESRVNVESGRYQRVELPERASGAEMPQITPIDMRRDSPERGRWLSSTLVKALTGALEDKAQSLLFLNRRGYAPLTLCRTCGHRFQCPDCSAWLVEHRSRKRLICHHCGHSERVPDVCPSCDKPDTLVACGPGVERVAEEVSDLFPEAKVLVLSSDLPGGQERVSREMRAIEQGEVDIVVGTQLVAKGHNFPLMRLVGVVDADLGLANGDPRAAERTFQLLAQVTGRAGRITGKGRGFLQTYAPEHPVIQALLTGDQDAFYAQEIEARRGAGLPPFGRMAALVISGPQHGPTERFARELARCAPKEADVRILGPAEAALALVRGRHRFRLLTLTSRKTDLQGYLRHWLASGPQPKGGIRLQVDVDPQNFL